MAYVYNTHAGVQLGNLTRLCWYQNDEPCNQNMVAQFNISNTWDCYYNTDHPRDVLFFRIPGWNVAAIVWMSLGFAVWLVTTACCCYCIDCRVRH